MAFLTPILLLIVLRLPSADPGGKLQITMLDVGQGESIHLRYPDGRDALVDTGGFLSPLAASSQTVGRRLVSRYLWKERIRSLQYILLTHGDTDHTQGYDFIRRAFPVRRLFLYDLYQEYRGPSVRILKAGDHFVLGEVEHFVLHPPEQALLKGDAGDPNNSSLVVLLRYKKFSMLLTGDIDASVEKALLPGLEPITILKAAHHGSRFSSSEELLEVVQPKLALISAGRKNVFGHPARATLTRLAKAGVPALSTSQWGSLRIETDGYGWKVFHYSIDQARFRELRLTPSP